MSLKNDIQELIQASVIDQDTGQNILNYYENKSRNSGNRLIIAFSALGAVLVGLGIILIVAHNWDNFSKPIKTFFAFLPLIIGQAACFFVLLKKQDSVAWREGSAGFLFFAVASSISIVAQIYNIPGGTGSFLFTWMLLSFPLIYLMNSSMVSLLYIVGVTSFGAIVGYDNRDFPDDFRYFLLLALVIPYYIHLMKNRPGNFLQFHHLGIGLSLIITLGTLTNESEELILLAYFSLLASYLQLGKFEIFSQGKKWNNVFQFLGFFGTLYLLYLLSFDSFWYHEFDMDYRLVSLEGFVSLVLISTTIGLMVKRKREWPFDLIELSFLVFAMLYFLNLNQGVSIAVMNLLTLAVGIQTTIRGSHMNHLGILNLGLIIIAILIACRFFDQDLSFVARGIIFVMVGLGFFAGNYWMVKKRRENDQ